MEWINPPNAHFPMERARRPPSGERKTESVVVRERWTDAETGSETGTGCPCEGTRKQENKQYYKYPISNTVSRPNRSFSSCGFRPSRIRSSTEDRFAPPHHTTPHHSGKPELQQEPSTLPNRAMALLLETTVGDLVIDLDVEGSPALCKNVLKLAKARYYTGSLVYNVQPNRFCQLGDPCGDGTGGACIYGLLDAHDKARKSNGGAKPDVLASQRRFLRSDMGRALTEGECRQKGRVVATEMNGIQNTIGSQLLITVDEGPERALDSFRNDTNTSGNRNRNRNNKDAGEAGFAPSEGQPVPQTFRSVGTVAEDDSDVLGKINAAYCDADGRPYADIRVLRALVIDDPYEDPEGMDQLLEDRGVRVSTTALAEKPSPPGGGETSGGSAAALRQRVSASPEYERPPEERVEIRISASEVDQDGATEEEDRKKLRLQEEERLKRDDKSRAMVLEMLGDLPSADIKAPENVLFVCKLNSITEDDDLELIFSRFDEKVSVEIVRDHKTGASLQYAFAEFTTKEQAAEAYFKMNNALIDDRRIKVDFSQSVSKVWDRFNQRNRKGSFPSGAMPRDPFHEQKRHGNRGREQKGRGHGSGRRDDRRGANSRTSNNYSPRRDHESNHRDDRYRDSSTRDRDRYRGADYSKGNHDRDRNKNRDRDRDRSRSGGHRDGRHDPHHRNRCDRDRKDHRSFHEGRSCENRDRGSANDSGSRSRSRHHEHHRGRREKSPSNHRTERKRRQNSDADDGSNGDDRNRSREAQRRRRDGRDRRRRSHSRSSSRSRDDHKASRSSGHRKSKRSRDRKGDDERRDHKRDRRDRKHRYHRSGSNRHRRGRSDSRS